MAGESIVEAEVSILGMQMDRESAMDVQIDGKSAINADAGVVGMQIDGKSAIHADAGVMGVQIDGKSIVDIIDACVVGVQIDGKSVMNADVSIVGIDVMGSGTVGMQEDGKSVADVAKGIVDAVLMSSGIMDMQSDGKSVMEVVEGIMDAGVMDDFMDDAGASCVVEIIYAGASDGSGVSLPFDSDAVCGTCHIMDSVCINHDDHGSMEMYVKAPDKGHDIQQGQSLWKGIPDPGGVKQYVIQQECVTEYAMQQECATEKRQSLWKQILDPGGVGLFGV
jgi:hypothetical protein